MTDVGGRRDGTWPHSSRRARWWPIALTLGVAYALVGITFALPATHVLMWRRAAWLISAFGFGAHLLYERFRLQSTPVVAASHVALAAALGAFGLAVGANVHSAASSGGRVLLLRLSLAIWPVIVGIAAFVVALIAGIVLHRAFARRAANAGGVDLR